MSTHRQRQATRRDKDDYFQDLHIPEHDAPRLSYVAMAALAYGTAHDIAELPMERHVMPFGLWLVFCCPWGGRFTRAVVPFDDITDGRCDYLASMLDFPNEPEDIAIVVFQRRTAEFDANFFARFRSAASRYDAVPWMLYAAGPDGATMLGTSASAEFATR
jgi:hypothetical protein